MKTIINNALLVNIYNLININDIKLKALINIIFNTLFFYLVDYII